MYGFSAKFTNAFTGESFERLIEIDTCMFGYDDIVEMGYDSIDAFVWAQAGKTAAAMRKEFNKDNFGEIMLDGVSLLYC